MEKSIRPHLSRLLAAGLGTALTLLSAGCQSTTVGNPVAGSLGTPSSETGLVGKSRSVVVYDFAFDVSNLNTQAGLIQGREGPAAHRIRANLRPEETPTQRAMRLAGLLSETIVSELNARRIPATRRTKDLPWPASGLVVAGQFLEVDEGNRFKRAMVGFGAGRTEVLAQVEVFDLAESREEPVLVYGTGSGSTPTPGSLILRNPWAMAAKYVLSRNATDKDVRVLGQHIARDLAQLQSGTFPQP